MQLQQVRRHPSDEHGSSRHRQSLPCMEPYQSTVVRCTGPERSKFSLSDIIGSEILTIAVSDAIMYYYILKYSPETCKTCNN